MKQQKMSEVDLAKAVVEMLTEWGWEVYQEVQGPGGRCDIVGKRENILWAIECKISFGLPIIDQAFKWICHAHYVSVAVPTAGGRLANLICNQYGIGVLIMRHGSVIEDVKPRLFRKIIPLKLYEEQKTFCEAGSNCGGHWTDFKRTVRNLVAEVGKSPGIEFNQVMKHLEHHYSSLSAAKSCLRGFIGTVIPELRVEIVNKKLCVFPADKEKSHAA
jgi:hypothetical protein